MLLPSKTKQQLLCAVDPGTKQTGYVYVKAIGKKLCLPVLKYGVAKNNSLAASVLASIRPAVVICEKFEGGRFFGKSSIETVLFIGELKALCRIEGIPFVLLPRRYVRFAMTGKASGKGMDTRVRHSLISTYGEPGTSKAPGKTYGITSHVWAALGLAHTYATYGTTKPY